MNEFLSLLANYILLYSLEHEDRDGVLLGLMKFCEDFEADRTRIKIVEANKTDMDPPYVDI